LKVDSFGNPVFMPSCWQP